MLAAMFILAGCATPKNFDLNDVVITPVDGQIVSKYVPGNGSLEMQEAFAINDQESPRGTIHVDYSVIDDGSGLLWTVTFASSDTIPITANVRSDKRGNIDSLELSPKELLRSKNTPQGEKTVAMAKDLFHYVFMPLLDADATKTNAISERPPLSVSLDDINLNKSAKAVVSGMTTYNGIQCYVVKYHGEGTITVPSTREVLQNVREVFLLINKDTMMPVVGESRNVTQINRNTLKTVTNISRLKLVS